MKQVEVIIIGGGMIGLALATGLGMAEITVHLIDVKPFLPCSSLPKNEKPYDLRVSAITPKTARLLSELGVWQQILSERAGCFESMYVYDKTGSIYFDSDMVNTTALGWIIENSLIQSALLEKIKTLPSVVLQAPCQLKAVMRDDTGMIIETQSEGTFKTELLVGADGANSWLRNYLNIDVKQWSYEQTAIVANIHCQHGHQNQAWQRFLKTGPLAVLPLKAPDLASIVWSLEDASAKQMLSENEIVFSEKLTDLMGVHLGKISLRSERLSFPLMMRHIAHYVKPGLAFIGDAAHTIHPLAGQGANLGFYDVAKLLQVILTAKARGYAVGHYPYLRQYERERKTKVAEMIILMELFNRGFSNEYALVGALRNQALSLANKITPFKKWLIGNC